MYDANTIRQFIKENFSYDVIAKQYISLYNNILKQQ